MKKRMSENEERKKKLGFKYLSVEQGEFKMVLFYLGVNFVLFCFFSLVYSPGLLSIDYHYEWCSLHEWHYCWHCIAVNVLTNFHAKDIWDNYKEWTENVGRCWNSGIHTQCRRLCIWNVTNCFCRILWLWAFTTTPPSSNLS